MCLIAYSPKGEMVDRGILAYAYNQNGDGVGVMSAAGIEKFMGKKALKRMRRYVETYLVPEKIPFGIHFRWATHGAICMMNTHPYEAPEGKHWVMHNGVISMTTAESTDKESDTAVYVRKHLTAIEPYDNAPYWRRVENQIGWGNKLLVMDKEGQFKICHEDAGEWIDGIWFSNTYSLPASKVPNRGYYMTRNHYSGWGEWDAEHGTYSTGYKAADAAVNTSEPEVARGAIYRPVARSTATPTTTPGVVIERDGTNVVLLQRRKAAWTNEDRRSYYEALEAGLSPASEAEYYDEGTDGGTATLILGTAQAQGEIAAARALQEAIAKEVQPIGGDFANPEDDEEQTSWRKYLARVAAGIYV